MMLLSKGRVLLRLCANNLAMAQASMEVQMNKLAEIDEDLSQNEFDVRVLKSLLESQKLQEVYIDKPGLDSFLQKQTQILRRLHNLSAERAALNDARGEVVDRIASIQSKIAYIKRREMKFVTWTNQLKRQIRKQADVDESIQIEEAIGCRSLIK